MIKINLVSEGKRPVVSRKTKEKLGIAGLELGEGLFMLALLIGVVAIAAYWYYLHNQVKERDAAITAAQAEVDQLAQVLKEVDDYKIKKEKLEHKIGIINDLKRAQWGPVRIMDQISTALPELLWLDTMTLQGNNIELHGNAFNTNQIAAFIENLGKVPEFQEPRLRDTSKNGPVYKFVITFNFAIVEPKAQQQKPGAAAPAAAAKPAPPAGT